MAITLTSTGKPQVVCPVCNRTHAVRRNGNYARKKPRNWHCSNCGTSWPATQEEMSKVMDIFKDLEEKRQAKNTQAPKANEQEPTEKKSRLAAFFGVDDDE